MPETHTPQDLQRLAERIRGQRTDPSEVLAELNGADPPQVKHVEDVAAAIGSARDALEHLVGADDPLGIYRIRAADALERAAAHANASAK